ncbi:UNVERIFIED_CONTAM: hypothetical protein Slati_1735300 [Sesamum latifolium]|uniref:Uncharacterized protein n=1 Tax=Sesamum latifolium TaxID=2727402 RepID=A0AAW2WVK4_9LAMI
MANYPTLGVFSSTSASFSWAWDSFEGPAAYSFTGWGNSSSRIFSSTTHTPPGRMHPSPLHQPCPRGSPGPPLKNTQARIK